MDRRTDRQMDERVLSWGWLGQDGGEGQSHTHLEEGWGLWMWASPPNLCLPSMKNTLGKMRRLRWYLEDSPSFLKPVLHPPTSLSWKVTKPDSRVGGSIKAWSKGCGHWARLKSRWPQKFLFLDPVKCNRAQLEAKAKVNKKATLYT